MNLQNQIKFLNDFYQSDMFSECNAETIPEPLVPEDVRSTIVARCGLLEPAYSEPSVMHQLTNLWFHTNKWNFEHLVNIILAEYSPIENTDKYSEHTTERSGSGGRTSTVTTGNTDTHSGTDQRDIGHSGTDTTEHQVSAFNASTYQPDNKETFAHGEQISDDLQHGHVITSAGNRSESVTNTDSGTDEYTEHTHGNIGTMTNFELINGELKLLQAFNVYDWIAAKFERELCLQIY